MVDIYPGRANITTNGDKDSVARTAFGQAGYQLAALAVTLGIAIVGGLLTGILLRTPLVEQVNDEELMFDDETTFKTPEDYSLKLTEVKVQQREEEEMEKLTSSA